ncbi:MAG: DNA-processing protein DprA [Bacillota bacterium]|nr:DNA-processing protein DprA [Bacillota bacterium]
MILEQIPYYLGFNSLTKLSPRKARLLLEYFQQDVEAAWHGQEQWREALGEKNEKRLQEILAQRQQADPAGLYQNFLACGCGLCILGDPDYPELLSHIYDPPVLLFYYGVLPEPEDICIAMIGSRDFTTYGRQVAGIFSRDLATQGITVVSGMARGIDSICHEGAIHAGGRTLAVLGSGLDVVYPRGNSSLYQQICQQGAVISEFPLGMPALRGNFPQRNRIISGLCQAVLVVEASEKSGTMLTVGYALDQGRDVFAVPGPVTSPNSRGTNRLIRDGARMALSAEDIYSEYGNVSLWQKEEPLPKRALSAAAPAKEEPPQKADARGELLPGLSQTERILLRRLLTPVQLDELAMDPELADDAAHLAATLTMLEIRGLVKQLPGKYYQAVVKNIYR